MPQAPSAFVFLGIDNPSAGTDASLHNPHFQMDEAQMPLGAALHASLAVEWLKRKAAAGGNAPHNDEL